MKNTKAAKKSVAHKLGWNGSIDPTVPTQDQVDFLTKVGEADDRIKAHTRAECSERIKSVIKAQRANRNAPPTDVQLRFLEAAGYNRASMSVRTKGYCSQLIYKLKAGKAA